MAFAVAAVPAVAATYLEPGDAAPDFTLPDADGRDVCLSSLRGQRVIVSADASA